MASEMMEALMALCQERGIDQYYLIDRLEKSLAKSYEDILGLEHGAEVTIDKATGNIYVSKIVPKGEPDPETGEYAEFDYVDVTPEDTSRIAAHNAKAEIMAIVDRVKKEHIYEEFSNRIGDLISGDVIQSTLDFTILQIRKGVEAELPHFDTRRYPAERNERPRGERYMTKDKGLKAVIVDVKNPNEGEPTRRSRPTIIVSRTSPDFVRRLFELEVPEVYDGVVEIRSIAREPGVRSKVAVASIDSRLDPVGACVGPRGSRVRSVVSELRGERVDVVQWSDDPARCVAEALSPAKVNRVLIEEQGHRATVIVPDDQLSLAIGKDGQNARLAARLTGWKIDIKNESLAQGLFAQAPADEADDLLDGETAHRCEYVSKDGVRCRNMARPGSAYCGIHENADAALDLV